MSPIYSNVQRLAKEYPVRTIFGVALSLRLLLVLIISLRYGGTLFADDRLYLNMVQTYASGGTGIWDSYYQNLWNVSTSFLLPASFVYRLSFQSTFAILILSAIIGSAIPASVTRLLSKHARTRISFGIGIVLAMMPSQVLWSSLFLKDIYLAIGLIGITFALRYWSSSEKFSGFLQGLTCITLAMFFIQRIRLHSLIVACIALFLSALFLGGRLWLARIACAVALFAIMPSMIGGGYFGSNFAGDLANGMEEQRAVGAIGASTGVVEIPTTTIFSTSSSSSSSSSSSLPRSSPIVEELKYLPSGLKVMLLDPTPGQLSRSRSLYLAFAEHLVWYPALFFCLYGVFRRRKWTADLIFAGFVGIGLCSMWALHEGNFGTAFRHRTEFVWIVFLFAGLGIQQIVEDRKAFIVRRSMSDSATA